MNLGARWTIEDVATGKSVKYENFVKGIGFDCGIQTPDKDLHEIMAFIISEGDPGDIVILNGSFYSHTLTQESV